MKERFYSKKCNSTTEIRWAFVINTIMTVFWLTVLTVVVMGGVK